MQALFVIVCILASAAYLVWQFYQRFFKADGKCDGCAIGKLQEK